MNLGTSTRFLRSVRLGYLHFASTPRPYATASHMWHIVALIHGFDQILAGQISPVRCRSRRRQPAYVHLESVSATDFFNAGWSNPSCWHPWSGRAEILEGWNAVRPTRDARRLFHRNRRHVAGAGAFCAGDEPRLCLGNIK